MGMPLPSLHSLAHPAIITWSPAVAGKFESTGELLESGGGKLQNQAGHVVTRVPGLRPPWRPAPPVGSASPGRPIPFG